jgi:cation:H+ antiporter
MSPILLLFIGLALLLGGGEVLVKGAVSIAKRMHISPMVVGLTVVSFGTSAPELLVSLQAALEGHADIAVGNVIGSNIANLALVLGCTALVLPIPVARNTIRIDWPAMMIATLMFTIAIQDGEISQVEGLVFFASLVGYIFFLFYKSRKETKTQRSEQTLTGLVEEKSAKGLLLDVGLVILGCIGLVFGADLLVGGATSLAQSYGISERVIAVTVVAFGTSVPELATSLIAAFRKELDISVGNLIGSNIFNICAVLGLTSIVTPIGVNQAVIDSDIYWVLGITFLVLVLSLHRYLIQRWKGALLVLFYLVYVFSVLN